MFLPSLLDGSVTFQESPVLRPERSVTIGARPIYNLRRLEEVPHVMLVSKVLDVLVFLPLLLKSNFILPHAEGFPLAFKEGLNLPIVFVKPVSVLA